MNRVYTYDEVESVADELMPALAGSAVVTFCGSLGAGKTTLIQALLRKEGIQGPIQSPTFTYVQSYQTPGGLVFHHFDLYRVQSIDEFLLAGFGDYLYRPNEKVLIEWPEIIMPLLTRDVCHISIDYDGIERRQISCQCSWARDGSVSSA